ncbi:tetraacyldisaccharide 4'-kinase [Psychromonas sp. CNPT3]|uniref:tetraacyldisaccharide 4'-kinase n=1 Tax=Psychromonas sp. CNPT3 TaxID=314282 RepID=UPI00006E80C4|nr:tetraacyldisaccharide 4'-kinase [Psychromonas sp. CNPT3]AGH80776.1 tetraacyldisaccharide 4'-kinase [Psychromonas sp. CNPT3]
MYFWYRPVKAWMWILYPFSILLRVISAIRCHLYKKNILKSTKISLPIIVVGNISVGGNGKTPFVIWLCELLQKQGYKPGIISRGYGGKSANYPLLLTDATLGSESGDEPLMIFKRLRVPIVVDPSRVQAALHLQRNADVDIIITDDGLQHYALQRDIEIVIVDGKRRFGNQHIMPVGPLREPLSRLNSVDFIINNGAEHEGEISMYLAPLACKAVDGREAQLHHQGAVNACAGIGYPQRFFDTLEAQNFQLNQVQYFSDHHTYKPKDFTQFDKQTPLLMTEKDAVKCAAFAPENWWYLPISAQLPGSFEKQLLQKIKALQ